MAKRGPKSSAGLAVVSSVGINAIVRPDPFPDLTTDQANEWVDVVNRLPADWFPRETHAVLAQYCRHVVSGRRVGEIIESHIAGKVLTSDWIETLDRLLKMQEREGRAMSSLATRMRITQQATTSNGKTKGSIKAPPPHMQ